MASTINIDQPVGALKTQLYKLLLSVDRVGWSSGNTSGRFDVRRTSRMLAGSERVFKQRTETPATTTAVSIIIDISGSMSDHDRFVDPEEYKQALKRISEGDFSDTRIGVATQCAYAIATAVERSNCEVEVVGFGSRGSMPLTLNGHDMRDMYGKLESRKVTGDSRYAMTKLFNIKSWTQKTSARADVFRRLYEACKFGTADYQAVRSVTERLSQHKADRKIVIVLTDGAGDYDILRKFCDMSEQLYNIPVLAVGIQTDARTMNATYKRFVTVSSLKELTEVAIKQLIDQIKK